MVEARQACSGEPFFPLPENNRKGRSEKGFERTLFVPIADSALFRLQILFGKKRLFFTHGVKNGLFFREGQAVFQCVPLHYAGLPSSTSYSALHSGNPEQLWFPCRAPGFSQQGGVEIPTKREKSAVQGLKKRGKQAAFFLRQQIFHANGNVSRLRSCPDYSKKSVFSHGYDFCFSRHTPGGAYRAP